MEEIAAAPPPFPLPPSFVVQVKDLKTHEPLGNVYVDDTDLKFGYNTMDNGYLLPNNVKVPHVNMSVDPNTHLDSVRSTIVLQSISVMGKLGQ